jgi:ribose transport system substrate-binding protein
MSLRRLSARHRLLVSIACVTLLALPACGSTKGPRGSQQHPYRIAVIPKGQTHEFWRTIHAGAIAAKRELLGKGIHVELIWKGPLREDDREQQVQVVESFASEGVDGIVLAPLDDKALVRPVEEAARLGVPTVIMDSALASDQIVSFVATDNYKGGEMGADALGEAMSGKGRILLLRYAEGSASTTARESGFLGRIKAKWPGLELLSSDQYAGATRDTAKRAAENLLNRFGKDVQGMFVVNESATSGMLLALQDAGLAGKVKFVGFDSNQAFVDAIRKDELQGFVLQNPFRMASLAVETLVDHLQGRPVPKQIDTGVTVVTAANLDAPEIQALIKPPLEQYLAAGE